MAEPALGNPNCPVEFREMLARVQGVSAEFAFLSPKHQADTQQTLEMLRQGRWGIRVAQKQQGRESWIQSHEDHQLQQPLQKLSPFQLSRSPDSACCRKSDSLYLELCSKDKQRTPGKILGEQLRRQSPAFT